MRNTSFFGIDFFPTPIEVIDRMLMDTDVMGKYVLEPSAGSGNIVDALTRRGAAQVAACEIDDRLRKVLSGKCDIIAHDFMTLTSEQVSHIDLIIMNPPFSKADDHILHAYDIAPEGCKIISLCNKSMLERGYYASRKRSQIMELVTSYGMVEDYGRCFSKADRDTDCEISCVTIWKPKTGVSEFEDYFSDLTPDEGGSTEGVMPYNAIRDIVNRYVEAVKRFDAVMEANKGINELTSVFDSNQITFGASWTNRDQHYGVITRDMFKKELQKAAWKLVFDKMDMERYVTKSVREDINRYVERQVNAPFTMSNIFRMLTMIAGTHENRMHKTLLEAFDKICSFSADNSTAGEKWRTNSDYMVNKRFIVPYMTSTDTWYGHDGEVHLNTRGYADDIEDVIRALCYITGTPYERTCQLKTFVRENAVPWGQWTNMGKSVDGEHITGFFKIRGYKKGTMHFEFLDENVWRRFNEEVAKIKGWQLPKHKHKQIKMGGQKKNAS